MKAKRQNRTLSVSATMLDGSGGHVSSKSESEIGSFQGVHKSLSVPMPEQVPEFAPEALCTDWLTCVRDRWRAEHGTEKPSLIDNRPDITRAPTELELLAVHSGEALAEAG